MRPDIFLATIGRGSNGSNALEVTEDRAAVTAESQDNIINRVNNVSQYGPSWHYVPGIGVAGTAYAEVPGTALGDLAFSRASSKTRTNAAGVVETIGNNVPPHDYRNADGSLSTFPRLNLEPQRTNLVPNGLSYNGATGVAYNTAVSGSPMAGVNCARITKNEAAGTLRYANQDCSNSALTGSTAYVLSSFFKYDGVDFATTMEFNNSFQWGGTSWRQIINIASSGITLGTSTSCTSTVQNWGSGWYRVNVSITTGASPTGSPVTYLFALPSTLSTGQGFLHALPQFEAGAYQTTYIPTTTAAVTRLRDFCLKGNIGNTSTAGTLFTEFDVTRINSSNGQYLIGMAVGTVDTLGGAYSTVLNSISIIANGPILQGRNNGLSTNLFSLTPSVGNNVKIIMRYNGTNVVAFVNGVKQTIYTDTSVGVKNFIRINNAEESTYNARQLAFFSSELTDAQCIQLTTL